MFSVVDVWEEVVSGCLALRSVSEGIIGAASYGSSLPGDLL